MKTRLSLIAALGLYCFASSSIAHAQQVKADTGGVAIGGNVSSSTINIGVPAEQLAALVRQAGDLSETQKKLIAQLEAELDLNQHQIHAALDVLGEANVPPERLGAELVEFAERFKVLQATASAQPGDDPRIAALKADVQKAIDAGELAKADALLADVETEQKRALDRLAVNAADTSSRRGQIARTRLRYREAAMHFANAAVVFPQGSADEDKRTSYLQKEAYALYQQGDEFGDNGALVLAIERYKRLVALTPRERAPLEWAWTQNNLGNALIRLGERESDRAKLEEAVAAYREALKEWTRERVPLDWAVIQNNLGATLLVLGAREGDTAKLEEAVVIYREALKEWTRERVPLGWAMIQNNLGAALQNLGELESDTAKLEEAVAAYREALEERTRERVPLYWARTQSNLGTALRDLGEQESDTARLEEAVAAYREALTKSTRERVPLDWARTQNSLGAALQVLGEQESDAARLEEAVAAYREALKEWTRERVPLDWARTQNDLGNALQDLGDTARLEEAVAAYREALKEWTRELVPRDWAAAQNNLGNALKDLAKRESDTARLEEAVGAYREALKERMPLDFVTPRLHEALQILGYARFNQGEFAAAALDLQEAVDGSDPYPILWLYLARARAGRQNAKTDLEQGVAGLTPAEWPFPVIKLFLEQVTPEAMVAAADKPEERCEAQYYLGEWHLLREARANSIKALRNAVNSCPKNFIEYAGALSELKRLEQ